MKKWYGALLFVLLTANSVWPEERPPLLKRLAMYAQGRISSYAKLKPQEDPTFLKRLARHVDKMYLRKYVPKERPTLLNRFVRYMHLHKASKFIKKQYRDKHKRRAWLSVGTIGIAIFLSQRFELFKTFWRSKEKKRRDSPTAQQETSPHKKQPQSHTDSQTVDLSLPPTPPPSRNKEEKDDGPGSDMPAPHGQDAFQQELLATLPESTERTENQEGTAISKSDAEVQQEQEAREMVRQAVVIAKILRKRGIRHIAQNAPGEEQQQNGTIILHSNDEEEDARTGDAALPPTHLKDIPDPVAPGAEGLEAALKAQGVRVAPPAPLKSVRGLIRADTSQALPHIQAHREQGESLEQATHAALEELRQDPRIAVEEVTIQQTLERAKKMMREQESAKGQLRAGIAQKDFEQMLGAVMNGANIQDKTGIPELIELTTNVGTLTPAQQSAFDCIVWELYEKYGVQLSEGTVAALAKRRQETRRDVREIFSESPED